MYSVRYYKVTIAPGVPITRLVQKYQDNPAFLEVQRALRQQEGQQ